MRHVKTTAGRDPALLLGLESGDDAAVYRIGDDQALVQTVDFFTPIVDDPYDWGRIAAINAVSDVYAVGGRPLTALNLVGWPRALDLETLGRVLQGAGDACNEEGVTVVGGHSVDDPEPKFGLAVTGTVHPDQIVRKDGAPAGCSLVLTKPLGMGIISSGIKEGKTSPGTIAEAVRIMGTSNKAACAAMLEVGARAATDVTGYGLMGHLLQMLDASVSAEISFDAIPVLPEAFSLAQEGVLPGGSKSNRHATEDRVDLGELDDVSAAVIFDAQTSGGLLIAVEENDVDDLVGALKEKGVEWQAVIGRLVRGDGRIRINS